MSGPGRRGFTVGSLLGQPQARVAPPPARAAGLLTIRKKNCCRSMCAGCPWAEAQRARRAGETAAREAPAPER